MWSFKALVVTLLLYGKGQSRAHASIFPPPANINFNNLEPNYPSNTTTNPHQSDSIPNPSTTLSNQPSMPLTNRASLVEATERPFVKNFAHILKRITWLEYLANAYIEADDIGRANKILNHLQWWNLSISCLVNTNPGAIALKIDSRSNRSSLSTNELSELLDKFDDSHNQIYTSNSFNYQNFKRNQMIIPKHCRQLIAVWEQVVVNPKKCNTSKDTIIHSIDWIKSQFPDTKLVDGIIQRIKDRINLKQAYLSNLIFQPNLISEIVWNRLVPGISCTNCGVNHPILGISSDAAEDESIHESLLAGNISTILLNMEELQSTLQNYSKTRLVVSIIHRDVHLRGCLKLWNEEWYLDRRIKQAILDVYASIIKFPNAPQDYLKLFVGFKYEKEIVAKILISMGHPNGIGHFQSLAINNIAANLDQSSDYTMAIACWNQLNAQDPNVGRLSAITLYNQLKSSKSTHPIHMSKLLTEQGTRCPEDRGVVANLVPLSMYPGWIFSPCNTPIPSTPLVPTFINKCSKPQLQPDMTRPNQTIITKQKLKPKKTNLLTPRIKEEIEKKFNIGSESSASSTAFIAIAPLSYSQIKDYYRLYRQLEQLEQLIDDLNPLNLHGLVPNDAGMITPGAVIPMPSNPSRLEEPLELTDPDLIAAQEASIQSSRSNIPLVIDGLKNSKLDTTRAIENVLAANTELGSPKLTISSEKKDPTNSIYGYSPKTVAEFYTQTGKVVGKPSSGESPKENATSNSTSPENQWAEMLVETPSMTIPVPKQPSSFVSGQRLPRTCKCMDSNSSSSLSESTLNLYRQTHNHELWPQNHVFPIKPASFSSNTAQPSPVSPKKPLTHIYDWTNNSQASSPNLPKPKIIHSYEQKSPDHQAKLAASRETVMAPFVHQVLKIQKMAESLSPLYVTSSQTPTLEFATQMDHLFRTQEWILLIKQIKAKLGEWKKQVREQIRFLNLLAAKNIYMERLIQQQRTSK